MGVVLLCTGIAGCASPASLPTSTNPLIPNILSGNVSLASDYEAVYAALLKSQSANYAITTGSADRFSLVEQVGPPQPNLAVTAPAAPSAASDGIAGRGDEYSKTNVQVDGIDEGDIVKTDGTYIYSLQYGKLSIFKADGANTRLVSVTEVVKNNGGNKGVVPVVRDAVAAVYEFNNEYAVEMYLCGDHVVIITQYYSYSDYWYQGYLPYGYWGNQPIQICKAYVYDVSEVAAPHLVHELGQDGDILSSRLIGNTLYLISTYYVYSFSEDEPETYIPALYADSDKTLVTPDCIVIMPYVESTGYTIVSAIDIPSGTIAANQTILGGGSLIYMSADNLYIASNEYRTEQSDQYTHGVYNVVDYLNYNVTNIVRLDISGGEVKAAAHGSVPGYLNNQFSMDEYRGYLRVVTTDNSSMYSIYTDIMGLFSNYKWGDSRSANGLYVLDMSLERVGEVDNLAPGEMVYSVRFNGDIGYFVTFRMVDPLFAVDLSDPSNPVVLSALKIPGFSQYLHVYSDGLLFGLGYDADEKTGRTGAMKLSMFDTSDPADVTEAHTFLIETYYSTALYNHKAILIDAEKNIIAFPGGSEYLVYGYSEQTGFYLRASINLDDMRWNDSRGLYISEYFYVVSDSSIIVIDMNTFAVVKTLNYGN